MSHNFTYYDFAICFDASSSLTGVFLRFPLPLLSVYFSKIFLAFFKKKKNKSLCEVSRVHVRSAALVGSCLVASAQPWGPQPARLLCPWEPPGKNTGVGCRARFQTQAREGTHVFCTGYIAREFFTAEPPGKPIESHSLYQLQYIQIRSV